MKLPFVENFADGKVVMLVYGAIGRDPETGEGIDGAHFAQVLNYLQGEPSVNEIEVRVNSGGGVLLDAIMIFNAIRSSNKPCNTIIDGIAASSGGLIAMAGQKRSMNDFGRLMVHAPSLPDKLRETLDDNTIKMLDQFQDLIADVLASNSRHNKAAINTLINAETWFTASQALNDGFVDEIINTDRKFNEIFDGLDLKNADLSLVVNQITNFKQDKNIMKTVKNTLGLVESASEDAVNTAIQVVIDAKNEAVDALTVEQDAHQATNVKLAATEIKAKEVNDAAATAYVENAIKEGKFSADKKDELIAQAINNPEGFRLFLEAMATPAKKITDVIDTKGDAALAKANEVIDGKLDGKTFRELEKTSPKVLNALLANEPKKHAALYAAQYQTA